MIRLLHLADLHIGIENYGRIDAATGLHTRLIDYLDRLDEAIRFGLAAGVHLVLIAGDIYKNRSPNPTHQREFARRLGPLRDAGIPVFILTGNHDISPSVGRANSVEIFHALHVPGVTVADRPGTHTLDTTAGRLQIIALPWVTRHNLLTRDDLRNLSLREIDAQIRLRIDDFLTHSAHSLDPTLPTVLTLHATIDGALPGAERGMTLGKELSLPRSSLQQPGIDYVALGHIHRHQALGDQPPLVYPGSIERVDFGERDEEKGCVLVELPTRQPNGTGPGDCAPDGGAGANGAGEPVRWQFHRLDARPFVSIDVDVRRSSDPEARIAAAIARHDLRRAVVRVVVQATREQAAALREETIRHLLTDAEPFLIAAVAIEAERETRRRLPADDEELLRGLSTRRALEIYLKQQQTEPERVALLLAAADELLAAGQPPGEAL